MKHLVRQMVRFGEVDAAGIVYYPHFYNYFHITLEEFFNVCVRRPYDEVIAQERVGFPAVHVETDFRSPLRHGEVIDVEMTIAHIGERSFTSRYRVFKGKLLCAEAAITTATVDLDAMQSIPIPPRYREVLERYLHEGEIP